MSKVERRSFARQQFEQEKELGRFGNMLWRGEPLEVLQTARLNASDSTSVTFGLTSDNLPFGGIVSTSLISQLEVHVRSRYAHIGVDVQSDICGAFVRDFKQKTIPDNDILPVELELVNHSGRPIILPAGEKPFHFFFVPPTAYIKGKELEDMVGNTDDKAVRLVGNEKHWRIQYMTSPSGELQAEGIFLRIDPYNRVWIPPSDDPIQFPDSVRTYQEARELLFRDVFKAVDDRQYPMPEDELWIGRGPFLMLNKEIYAKIDHDAYVERNGTFYKVGMQTHSPLLEGLRTQHYPHFELKGKADWVRIQIVRNGHEAKAG